MIGRFFLHPKSVVGLRVGSINIFLPKNKHDQFGTSTKSNESMYYWKMRKFMEIFQKRKNPSKMCWFSASFLPPTKGPPTKRPTPDVASDAISDASEPEPTVQPVEAPKTMGGSPPMAVPSVQGFAKWNLERCPEVLEAKHLMHLWSCFGGSLVWRASYRFWYYLFIFVLLIIAFNMFTVLFFFSFFVFGTYHHFGFNDLSFFQGIN